MDTDRTDRTDRTDDTDRDRAPRERWEHQRRDVLLPVRRGASDDRRGAGR